MILGTVERAWLRELYPGYFSLTMASGIIAIALDMFEMALLSDIFYVIALISWLILLGLYCWRLLLYPKTIWFEIIDPSTTFMFFSFVASTDIIGMLLYLHDVRDLALVCWVFAFLGWVSLLHCSFSVLVIHNSERKANVVHGGWLICIVGTQSLVLLGVNVVDQLGDYATYMAMGLYMLWGVGLILYAIFVTLFCYRIFFLNMDVNDYTPLMWVIMGAAAICANAGSSLVVMDPIIPALISLNPVIDGVALLFWTWASWWIPLLFVIGCWKHFVRHLPLRYDPRQWSIVFPLGMYAVTSFRLTFAGSFEPMHQISHIMTWVAIIVWCVVTTGLIHLLVKRKQA